MGACATSLAEHQEPPSCVDSDYIVLDLGKVKELPAVVGTWFASDEHEQSLCRNSQFGLLLHCGLLLLLHTIASQQAHGVATTVFCCVLAGLLHAVPEIFTRNLLWGPIVKIFGSAFNKCKTVAELDAASPPLPPSPGFPCCVAVKSQPLGSQLLLALGVSGGVQPSSTAGQAEILIDQRALIIALSLMPACTADPATM